jgi:hypothetical protein
MNKEVDMWIVAQYIPTAFFSLKPHMATSTGGKTLIVPTPFAIKTGLLDVAIRTQGLEQGKTLFSEIQRLAIAVNLPRQIVVNNTFVKIRRFNDSPTKGSAVSKAKKLARAKKERKWPYKSTIGFREYAQFSDSLKLAFRGMTRDNLIPLLIQLNYLGKRGGFVQLCERPQEIKSLSNEFTVLTENISGFFPLGTLQVVDDWGQDLTFERLNIYSDESITTGKHRIFREIVLPYQPVRSSREFTLYERIE